MSLPEELDVELPNELEYKIKQVVHCLVQSRWQDLEMIACCERVPPPDIKRVLERHGVVLALHPEDKWPLCIEVYATESEDTLFVDVDLWTTLGQCDLTLQLSCVGEPGSNFMVRIEDLRVL